MIYLESIFMCHDDVNAKRCLHREQFVQYVTLCLQKQLTCMQPTNKAISQTISAAQLRGTKREDPGDRVGVSPALDYARRSLHLLNLRQD